jgi:hypothetical protein
MTREKVVCVIGDDGAARDSLAFLLETDGFVSQRDHPQIGPSLCVRASLRDHPPMAIASSPM